MGESKARPCMKETIIICFWTEGRGFIFYTRDLLPMGGRGDGSLAKKESQMKKKPIFVPHFNKRGTVFSPPPIWAMEITLESKKSCKAVETILSLFISKGAE